MENKEKKMSYEELERYCSYLASQVNEMTERLKQTQFSEMVARLNFEFKVLELAKYFPKNYVTECSEDIQRVLVMENPNDEAEKEVQTDVQEA